MTLSPAAPRPGPDASASNAGVEHAGVPWATVLPLAVVLSFADGFWVTSMRGAVGAAGAGHAPFTTWWRESGVLVAAYACAVLGALVLARQWSRRGGGRRSTLVVAALLVVVAGTVVGVLHLAAGAASDYVVQWERLQMTTAMRGDCPADCLDRLRQDTLGLEVRAVTFGALLLLVTNLGSVVWVTMCRGGRLDVARAHRARAQRAGDGHAPHDLARQLRWLAATALVGAALIHAAVVPEHLEQWPAAGGFFALLAVAGAATAVIVLLRPGRAGLLLAVATAAGPLLVWAWSRAEGLPFGPGPGGPEPIGLPDGAAVVLEVVALVVALLLLRRAPALEGRAPMSDQVGRLTAMAVVAVTVIALAATQDGWFDVLPAASHG
ncbi:MAG TPA: hypothetical protein VFI44_05310 [Ornithinibacter sp.]|nr:hypothetical protein [Ornithinibacter sp.]